MKIEIEKPIRKKKMGAIYPKTRKTVCHMIKVLDTVLLNNESLSGST